MSQFFEANKRDPQACSFAGNGTVNAKASTTVSAVDVASSCLSNPGATFTPSAVPTSGGGSSSSGSSGGGSSGGSGGNSGSGKGGAMGLSVEIGALVGVSAITLLTAMSGVWVFV